MKNISILLLFVATLFITQSGFGQLPPVDSTKLTGEVHWLSIEEAVKKNKKKPKKFLIDLYTDWCGWCKVMERRTYAHKDVAKYVNENFYPVKFDAEQREDVEFNGKKFKFIPQGNRGVHELAVALTNSKLSYPTTVFLTEKMEIIQPLAGFMTAEQIEPILVYIGGGHFGNMTWDDFLKSDKKKF